MDFSDGTLYPEDHKGNVLPFPRGKTSKERAHGIEAPSPPSRELPPFVVKTRRLSSVASRIEYLRKISLETAYYLQEIENFKGFSGPPF
ncbi:MAG: hypothetical protein OXB88_07400 [Bacteriovoracales bacterium]|nr:hypothetical protein [Bacteriovoracales bacterium]